MRVLGRVRLSRSSEESTSIERQREIIEAWAKANDHTVVGWAEDPNTSGSVDPFDTAGLGPWLSEPKFNDWDILCAWKLDRLARRTVPLHRLFGLCQDHKKTLVCVADNIDLSTWVGRLVASVIAGVAEGELEAIRERTRGSQKKLRELGRWSGGRPLYGFKAQERADKAGWELVKDEHASGVLVGIIDKVLDGQSTESITRELNDSGELSPSDYLRQRSGKAVRGSQWSNSGIRQMLRSETLVGYSTHKGKTVRDGDGLPVLIGPELITREKFDRLQAALDARGFKVTNRSAKASPLLGVAYCGWCGRLMHLRQHHNKRRGKTYRYYQCIGGGGKRTPEHEPNIVKADELERLIEERFLDEYGHENVKEQVLIPATDHRVELDENIRAAEEIAPLLGSATSETMRKLYQGQLEAIDQRIARLEKLPVTEAELRWQESDETYADAWEAANAEEQRQLLLKRRVSVAVSAPPKGQPATGVVYHFYVMDVQDENRVDVSIEQLNEQARADKERRIEEFKNRPDEPDDGSEVMWSLPGQDNQEEMIQ